MELWVGVVVLFVLCIGGCLLSRWWIFLFESVLYFSRFWVSVFNLCCFLVRMCWVLFSLFFIRCCILELIFCDVVLEMFCVCFMDMFRNILFWFLLYVIVLSLGEKFYLVIIMCVRCVVCLMLFCVFDVILFLLKIIFLVMCLFIMIVRCEVICL